jgi:hypothetical protein
MIPSLFGKQEVGIRRVQKRFPRYGVPIWSLWPNIRFLPSIVAIGTPYCGKRFWTHQIPTSCLPTLLSFIHIEHNICSFFVAFFSVPIEGRNLIFGHKLHIGRQTGSRNLMGPNTLPTIWGTYMKLVTRYQISAINSCWEKCDEKWAYIMFNVYINQQSRQTGSRNLTSYRGKRFWTHQIPTSCLSILLIFIHI